MQVVFVHGVSTRSGDAGQTERENRDRLLLEVAFKGRQTVLRSPVWGDDVLPRAWGGASFPLFGRDEVASFSLADGLGARPAAGQDAGVLAACAVKSPEATVDTLFAASVDAEDNQERLLSDDQVADFASAADVFAGTGFTTSLDACIDDMDLVDKVRENLATPAAFGGIRDKLKEVASNLANRARNFASEGVVSLFRDSLNPAVAQFLGDIFVYLKAGEVRDRIRTLLVEELVAAHRARVDGEALVLIGHSLGGVILYDLLSSPTPVGLPDDFRVDLFLTVGSQPGLFEEMKLFDASDRTVVGPKARVSGPASVSHWMNVYDPTDLFGFRAEPIFAKATDLAFDSITGLLDSHTTYFKRPRFHARLRQRLDELNLR